MRFQMISSLRTLRAYPAAWAVASTFALNSFLFGLWASRIPEVQQKLALNEGALGFALLGMPLGAVGVMPLMGWIIEKAGAGKTLLAATLAYPIAMCLPPIATGLFGLAGALVLVGLGNGAMDIAMNVAGTAVEKQYRISILSVCHSFFSFGGMAGALAGSVTAAGMLPAAKLMLIGTVLGVGMAFVIGPLLTTIAHAQSSAPVFTLPGKRLLLLAFIGFCVMLGEGAMADWSAVYLRTVSGASASLAGLGYAGFSLAMGIGRLYGDTLTTRFSARRILMTGSLTAAGGLGLALLTGEPLLVIGGFSLAGLGYACLVPVLYSRAVALPGLVPASSIAAIAGAGYAGFLLGPPLIGLLAERTGLEGGILFVALLAVLAALCAKKLPGHIS
jgi:MFS family permease